MDTLAKDLRYAFRGLLRNPGFATIAILTLALGIGANTAIFSVVNTFLIRPLPYPEPDRLVAMFERNVVANEDQMGVAIGNFLDWQKAAGNFEQMSAYGYRGATLSNDDSGKAAERVVVSVCSANLFTTLGIRPAAGRTFAPEEDSFGAHRVAIIGYGLWQRQFGGLPNAIGKNIRLDGDDYEVIGVMPRAFLFPNRVVEVWRPILASIPKELQARHDLHNLSVVARLRQGVSVEQGRAEIDGISARYKHDHPDESTGKGANAVPLHGQLVQDVRTPLIVLLGAVGCVLLIACVNIASLLLTRAVLRTREIGIRAALGAGRGRIIRQLLTESMILAVAGGVSGAAFAVAMTRFLVENAPAAPVLVAAGQASVDPKVFLFAFGVAAFSGIGVGLFPALRVSRFDLAGDLKSGGRSATAARPHVRLRNSLVSVEMALSVVLLIACGLLMRSFVLLYQVTPGARVDQTLTMAFAAPAAHYAQPAQRIGLLNDLSDRLQHIPGVKSAGITSCAPLTGACNVLFYYVDGRPFTPGKFLTGMERSVDSAYFDAAGIPLLRGRTFANGDGIGFELNHPRLGSIIISESMARAAFPREDPIGKQIFFDYEVQRSRNQGTPVPHYEVIGVVGDVLAALDARPSPTMYRPLLDQAPTGATIVIHTTGEAKSVVAAAQNEIRRIDPGLAIFRIQTMDDLISASAAGRRFSMLLFAAFAILALVLVAIGLCGLVSHTVSQRKNEIGIRIALGATSRDVNRMFLFQGLKPAVAGMIVGIVIAAFAVRILRSQLFGVAPADPLTFVLVPSLLLVVAVVACLLPTIRATRLDPTVALRAE